MLWLERCSIVHAHTVVGVLSMECIALDNEIKKEKALNLHAMNPEDYHLQSVSLDKLLHETVETQRGWLCSVKIARGDFT